MARKVLVTGATGFIGRSLCRRLLADGFSVRGVTRQSVPEARAILARVEDWARIGSLSAHTDWAAALDGIDAIVHLAGLAEGQGGDPPAALAECHRVNAEGTAQLAHSAAQAKVGRFVLVSSVKVHGEKSGRAADGSRQRFSEADPPRPTSAYGISKWEAEQRLRVIAADTGMEAVVLRPPLVYGPGVSANFRRLMMLVQRRGPLPFSKVNNRRSLIYVDNLVDAIIKSLEHPGAGGRTFLVADLELSTPDLIRHIARAMGRKTSLVPVPEVVLRMGGWLLGRGTEVGRLLDSLLLDSAGIREALAWEPRIGPDEAMAATAVWLGESVPGSRARAG